MPNLYKRKQKMKWALAAMMPLQNSPEFFSKAIEALGIKGDRDLEILYAVLKDEIMAAKRAGENTEDMERFERWILKKRLSD